MDRIAPLKNPVQEYAWGSRSAIQALLGLPVPGERPAAELWLGAHPKAPSRVFVDGGWRSLEKLIERNPVSVLGREVAERFRGRLPFLFKVLAADRPLSIQVHPDLEQARQGFERENRQGIPLDAPERDYRDPSHKPELLCALTPFEALKGFRSPGDIVALFAGMELRSLSRELEGLKTGQDGSALRAFFISLLSLDDDSRVRVIDEAAQKAARLLGKDRAYFWMLELSREYPGDIWVLSPLILNLMELKPGEAMYVPAGELHSYLRGVGVELMASSDNVLRGGLTSKHVDIPELLRVVDFQVEPVHKIRPSPGKVAGKMVYPTPAEEFQLSVIRISPEEPFQSPGERCVEIMICMEGEARVRGGEDEPPVLCRKGDSVIVPASVGPYRIEGKATLYSAAARRIEAKPA